MYACVANNKLEEKTRLKRLQVFKNALKTLTVKKFAKEVARRLLKGSLYSNFLKI